MNRPPAVFAIVIAWLLVAELGAQPTLLKDINATTDVTSSWPDELVSSGGNLYFTAKYEGDTRLPLVTDGTAGGTYLLKDIRRRMNGSVHHLTPFGQGIAFVADELHHGAELWVSDGTVSGTTMVIDLMAGSGDGILYGPVEFNGKLYFAGNDGTNGYELWESDGTASGTQLVKDINPGSPSSDPNDFAVVGNVLYFTAATATSGRELWKTDGTNMGTVQVADINPGAGSSSPAQLTPNGSSINFVADDGTHGAELWTSDGSVGGTSLVHDIYPGSGSSLIEGIAVLNNGTLIFSAVDGTHGREPWSSDGTTTQLIDDFASGTTNSNPNYITSMGMYVLFEMDADAAPGELWRSDGTLGGTTLVRDIHTSPGVGSYPRYLAKVGTECFFFANGGTGATGLWRSDGTNSGTVFVEDILVNSAAERPIVEHGGMACLTATNFGQSNVELWVSDGTSSGTSIVVDLANGRGDSLTSGFYELGSRMLFWADDGVNGRELWGTDGTTQGTEMLHNIAPGSSSSTFSPFGVVGGLAVFAADDGTHGLELWVTDGTPTGTQLLKDIEPGNGSSFPSNFTEYNGEIYFSASNSTTGRELWVTDGTHAGTHLVIDLESGTGSSSPTELTVFLSELYFAASAGSVGEELWKTDGTVAGTTLVKNIRNGGSSSPERFRVLGNRLIFTADDGTTGREPWVSDGTSSGTIQLRDIYPGGGSSYYYPLGQAGGYLFFRAGNASDGIELWRTDGTTSGTLMLADIAAGGASSMPNLLGTFGGALVFLATSAGEGREPWISNGMPSGTSLLQDIYPGTNGSNATFLGALATGFLLCADDGTHGFELWFSDGTPGTATLVTDNYPGLFSGCRPPAVGVLGGRVYFNGITEDEGTALWESDGTAAGTRMTAAIDPSAASVQIGMARVWGTRLLFSIGTAAYGHEPWIFDVGALNAFPQVSLSTTSVSYTENASPVTLDPAAQVSDTDSPDFDGGYLRVELKQGATPDDRLTIPNQGTGAGQIGVTGNQVTYGGVVVGTLTGGVGITALHISFNAMSSPAIAETILGVIQYEVLGDNPTATMRVCEITVSDGDGGVSTPVHIHATVIPVNDLPVVSVPTTGNSVFTGVPGGPFAATIQPATSNFTGAILEINDPEGACTISAVSVSPSTPPSISAPSVNTTLPSGSTFSWTGDSANSPPGTYTWTLTIEDADAGVIVVDASITIPNVAPTAAIGPDASTGQGTSASPFTGETQTGTSSRITLVQIVDANATETHTISAINPATGNPSSVFSVVVDQASRQIGLEPAGTLTSAHVGTYDFEVEFQDTVNSTTVWIRARVVDAPTGGSGNGGGSGDDDEETCSTGETGTPWWIAILTLLVLWCGGRANASRR